jgi:hypothetical protein
LNLLRARNQGHSGIDPGPFLKSDQGKSAEPRSRLNVSQGLQPADSAHSPINEPERATRQPRGRRENSLPQSLIRLWPKTRILVIQIVRHSEQQRLAILTNNAQTEGRESPKSEPLQTDCRGSPNDCVHVQTIRFASTRLQKPGAAPRPAAKLSAPADEPACRRRSPRTPFAGRYGSWFP